MKTLAKQLSRVASRLHRDEGGATMVEYILVIVAIALPVLGALIWFWDDIRAWFVEEYDEVRSGQGTDPH